MATAATLDDFAQLLAAAQGEAAPQRLLFVFAVRELEGNATDAQREAFGRGAGGYLTPCVCVDKAPDEVADFAALVAESEQTGQPWDVVFVAVLAGRGDAAPNKDQVDDALRSIVNAIHVGRVGQFAAFNRTGETLRFV